MLGSTVNPFATGIASGFADVPLSDGLVARGWSCWSSASPSGIWFVLRYADRVRSDPTASLVYDMKEANERHFAAGADGDAGGGGADRAAQGDPRAFGGGVRW